MGLSYRSYGSRTGVGHPCAVLEKCRNIDKQKFELDWDIKEAKGQVDALYVGRQKIPWILVSSKGVGITECAIHCV